MKMDGQRRLALAGGACGAAYLLAKHLLPGAPDFLMGLALGLGAVLLARGLVPEKTAGMLRAWKRRGWKRCGK